MLAASNKDQDLAKLAKFYSVCFPVHKICEWLSYEGSLNKGHLSKREFSFTLPGDIYTRYLSFNSPSEFSDKLQRDTPIKIDIGSIYNTRPSERKGMNSTQFRPLEKELVFDIDLTDYDDVRSCCQDKGICKKCWKFICVAVKIIDTCLEEDFGFKHKIWVFSGRRGIHCWVSDPRARQLSNAARKAIVSFIDLKRGGSEVKRKVVLPTTLHPSLKRSVEVVEQYFPDIMLVDQKLLCCDRLAKCCLDFIPETSREALLDKWAAMKDYMSTEKWIDFLDMLAKNPKASINPTELKCWYLYPRLDTNVSVQLNHLLKSPFCVHPSTGKVCVPLKASEIDSFDPNNCPTIDNLLMELETISNIDNTSIGPFLETFKTFVNDLKSAGETPDLSSNSKLTF